jgi:hypothetical protein
LFTGALENLFRRPLAHGLAWVFGRGRAVEEGEG